MRENWLRQKARESIEAGHLPPGAPARVWGGRGLGLSCPVCAERVMREQTGYELEFAISGEDGQFQRYALHVPCFFAWEALRQARANGDGTPADGTLRMPGAEANISGRDEHRNQ